MTPVHSGLPRPLAFLGSGNVSSHEAAVPARAPKPDWHDSLAFSPLQ